MGSHRKRNADEIAAFLYELERNSTRKQREPIATGRDLFSNENEGTHKDINNPKQ